MSTPRGASASRSEPHFSGNARFELKQVLGEGSMGVVYEAYDRERAMSVALKTVHALDVDALYRPTTEFRARADLEHRNLARLGELHHEDGHYFFTMELGEGWPFLDWVRAAASGGNSAEAPRASETRLRECVRQLASGLDAIHRSGKVHRDLKPSNVLVTAKGRVVILDFGLVGDMAPSQRSAGYDVVGTAAYMAPEQARTPQVTPAADSYSVGVRMYEALTGGLPFDGAPLEILIRKQQEDPPPPPPSERATLCCELLSRDPEIRPTAAAIVTRLASRALTEERPPAFVGRTAELRVLDGALDEVTAGATMSVFIEGESGIGKSALVRSFCERIEEGRQGTLIFAGRCYERESVPFKGIDGVVDALARELPVLRRVPAIARMRAPRPASPVELRSRAFRGLRALLGALARTAPIVIAIGDVQWADSDSIALLRDIVRPPHAHERSGRAVSRPRSRGRRRPCPAGPPPPLSRAARERARLEQALGSGSTVGDPPPRGRGRGPARGRARDGGRAPRRGHARVRARRRAVGSSAPARPRRA